MPLKRTEHWATRELHAFLLERAAMPFAWGSNDCALFAADAIRAFTGVDLAEDFRGKYDNEIDALTLVWKLTGKEDQKGTITVANAAEYCATKFGLTELMSPKLAQRGDLLVMEDEGRLIAGIVHLNGREGLSVGEDGLKKLPIASWRRAWRV